MLVAASLAIVPGAGGTSALGAVHSMSTRRAPGSASPTASPMRSTSRT